MLVAGQVACCTRAGAQAPSTVPASKACMRALDGQRQQVGARRRAGWPPCVLAGKPPCVRSGWLLAAVLLTGRPACVLGHRPCSPIGRRVCIPSRCSPAGCHACVRAGGWPPCAGRPPCVLAGRVCVWAWQLAAVRAHAGRPPCAKPLAGRACIWA